jgi:protein-S-isoprenylcysteine O-methyltransferase Ste14
MISGVCLILLGEAMLAASWPLLCWFILFVLGNVVWLPWHEEPRLEKRFGEDYRQYKANVPRWIPRLRPWDGADGDEGDNG